MSADTDTDRLERIEARLERIEAAIDRAEALAARLWDSPQARKWLGMLGIRP